MKKSVRATQKPGRQQKQTPSRSTAAQQAHEGQGDEKLVDGTRIEQAISMMADTQRQIARLESVLEIYQLVGQKIRELVGDGYVAVSRLNEQIQAMEIVGMYGLGNIYDNLVRTFKVDPSKSVYPLDDMTADELRQFRSGRLERFEGGLYHLLARKISKRICDAAERQLKLTGIYTVGLVWQNLHVGGLTILAKSEIFPLKELIETIANQATIAIKRIGAENAMRESEARYRGLLENAIMGVSQSLPDGRLVFANQAYARIYGYDSPEEMMAMVSNAGQLYANAEDRKEVLEILDRDGVMEPRDIAVVKQDGSPFQVLVTARALKDAQGNIVCYQAEHLDITELRKAEKAMRENEELFRTSFENATVGVSLVNPQGRFIETNGKLCEMLGYTREELMQLNFNEITHAEDKEVGPAILHRLASGEIDHASFEKRYLHKDGHILWVQISSSAVRDSNGLLKYYVSHTQDISERRQAEGALKRQAEELARLYRASGSLLTDSPFDLHASAQAILKAVLEEFGQTNCSIFLVEEDAKELIRIAIGGPYADQAEKVALTLDGPGLVPQAVRTGQCINAPDVRLNPSYVPGWEQARSELTVPLKIGERVIGVLDVQSAQPGAFSANDARLMTIFSERAALALEHARLYSQTERRLQNLASLRTIDMAIASSFDVHFTLGILLDQATKRLGVHAADVLIFYSSTQTLRSSVARGFRTKSPGQSILRLNESFAGQVIRERQAVAVENLAGNTGKLQGAAEWIREGFVSYIGVPLIAKGIVKGVLEIYQRGPMTLDQEQRGFLDQLAGQAAIAIDSAQLFENLQSSNAELMMAYDETIEGWSQALDLRDRETEGHSRRVTEMTVRLAGSLGSNPEELSHVRRGALLHDIGKLGVPDEILRKPGPLTDEEWVSMRKHPQFAYDMLAPITYLHPALDIPYCHHEKWDGSGYPRGLKENQIPLAARIFAVVDVWDALTSDRPYRKAWAREKALTFIQGQDGKHFDPKVVTAFLGEIANQEESG